MRALVNRAARSVAHRAGLVPRARVDQLTEALARAQGKIAELKKAVDDTRAEAATWKAKVEESTRRFTQLRDGEAARQAKRSAKVQEDLERVREREEKHRARIAELLARAQAAERAVRLSREQLMAVEVKLEILAGAITVV